jgi:hypothetical protein
VKLHGRTAVVSPWYGQFYLRRGEAPWASDRISEAGYEDLLEGIDGFAYVGLEMYGSPTHMTIEVHDTGPPVPEDAEHVVEVSMTGAGPLGILDWGDDEPGTVVAVPEGPLRLRVSWLGIGAALQHPDRDLSGPDESPERLLVHLWPGPDGPRVVHRRSARP